MKKNVKWLPVVVVLLVLAAVTGVVFGVFREESKEPVASPEENLSDRDTESSLIVLQGDSITVTGAGVKASGNTVTITEGGTYSVSGTLDNGQIYVDAGGKDTVILSLKGADLSNGSDAAVYVENAGRTLLMLEKGTLNRIQSGAQTEWNAVEDGTDENASGAAIYAKDDLAITGEGTLQVFGYINNGIHTTNNLTIDSGNIEVTAKNNGIKGKDSVNITGGMFSIRSGGDGIHSNGSVYVTGGSFVIASGDDGIHADTELTIEAGEIRITDSYEGMEANQMYLLGGTLNITAKDDGLNAYGGQDNMETTEGMPNLYLSGAEIVIDANGDGVDSNGNLYVEGGTVIINGPADDGNGAIDFGSENGGVCKVSGGTVFAIGSAGMAETFGSESEQCAFRYYFSSTLQEGNEVVVSDDRGEVLFEHTVLKPANSLVFSCPELEVGKTYRISVDGESAEIEQTKVSVTAGQSAGGRGFGGRGGMRQEPGTLILLWQFFWQWGRTD